MDSIIKLKKHLRVFLLDGMEGEGGGRERGWEGGKGQRGQG